MWLLQEVKHFLAQRRYVTPRGQLLQHLQSHLNRMKLNKYFCATKLSALCCLTCIEDESSGANRSSLPIFATFVWTLTRALSSFDSSNCCRKSKSCSLDKLSVSFSEDKSFESTAVKKEEEEEEEEWQ